MSIDTFLKHFEQATVQLSTLFGQSDPGHTFLHSRVFLDHGKLIHGGRNTNQSGLR
jgi:hypothetical protein